jgi:cellulose synthase/poly-beta-1,6-N-acetylglucosamine synthase-like glycosyltransferase
MGRARPGGGATGALVALTALLCCCVMAPASFGASPDTTAAYEPELRLTQSLEAAESKPVAPPAHKDAADAAALQLRASDMLDAAPPGPTAAALSAPPAPVAQEPRGPVSHSTWVRALAWLLCLIVLLIVIYTVRHYVFALNRLFGRQRQPFIDIDVADWPTVTVLIPAHNEERVIADCLGALLEVDYPPERLLIMPVNDRSTDRTRTIIDEIAARHPGRVAPLHRDSGKPGKAAALKDASTQLVSEIVLVFDADYVPGRGLVKQLTAPFFDPEVGAVMGRVVPFNTGTNLLTRLLDLERSGGYQVDQQARMNLDLVPQYGGTVGGVRLSALMAVGGWRDDSLTEDTDITYRLLIGGWKTVYQNRSECYEEVPEDWQVRLRQIQRWAKGHDQACRVHARALLASPLLSTRQKIDGALLLGVFLMSPMLILAWLLAITLYFLGASELLGAAISLIVMASYGCLGNFAAFFEIAAAARLDGTYRRMRLLPLNIFGFLVSMVGITQATGSLFMDWLLRRELIWHKTHRYRSVNGN